MKFQIGLRRLNACNSVAHAVAGHQGTEAVLERRLSGKVVVVDQRQFFQPGHHHALVLVLRIAFQIGRSFFFGAAGGEK